MAPALPWLAARWACQARKSRFWSASLAAVTQSASISIPPGDSDSYTRSNTLALAAGVVM